MGRYPKFVINNHKHNYKNVINFKKQCFDSSLILEVLKTGLYLIKHRAIKVAWCGEMIIGMCTAQTRISTARGCITARLEGLVVDENHRGRGIGNQLLVVVEEWAGHRGIDHLQSLADGNNKPGLEFYRKENWQPTHLVCLTKSP